MTFFTEPRRAKAVQLIRSEGLWHSIVMTGSAIAAGGLDYLFNIVSGRMLTPVEYSILISTLAILQILLHATNVIRNVVAYYTAEIVTSTGSALQTAPFLTRSWRWAWRWGALATAVMALLSPLLARLLQFESPLPLIAAALALLMLFVRPVTDGTLQGIQKFNGWAAVTVFQAALRLGFAILLIYIGWGAFGAVLALPMATFSALLLAVWLLRPQFRVKLDNPVEKKVSRRYSAETLIGLLSFAFLVNMDAILVKALFPPAIAGNYAPVVTLGKINLFIPLALAMVLFPKAVARHSSGQDARPILLLSLGAAALPGLALTGLFALFPAQLVALIFGDAYENPGAVLGMIGLATTLYAAISLWLNFALSTHRSRFVYALTAITAVQLAAILLFHDSITAVALIMICCGAMGNGAGFWFAFRRQ